jgi:beta-glucosidase
LRVGFTVSNTGSRPGYAVPELYVGLTSRRGVPEPPRQLEGFDKVWLAAGRTARMAITLDRRSFGYWSVARHRWSVARGCDRVMIGSSSSHLPLQSVVAQAGARCGPG